MKRCHPLILIVILIGIPGALPTLAAGPIDPLLEIAVNDLEPDDSLEITMHNGDRRQGTFAGRQDDHLLLRMEPTPGAPVLTRELPLENILRLKVLHSGVRRGFSAGFATGAIVGGGLSLLVGLAVASENSEGDYTDNVILLTGLGAAAGGLSLGAVGAGLGAMSRYWKTVYEASDALPESPYAPPNDTSLTLGLGWVRAYEGGGHSGLSGFYGTTGLNKTLGSRVALGPELGYYHLKGTIAHREGDAIFLERVDKAISIGLVLNVDSPRWGWGPFLSIGSGFYFLGQDYLGMSVGGGLRYRPQGDSEMKLELRRHFALSSGSRTGHLNDFITLGANFSFGL